MNICYSLTSLMHNKHNMQAIQKEKFVSGVFFIQNVCMEPFNILITLIIITLLHSHMLILCHTKNRYITPSKKNKIPHIGDTESLY